MSNFAIRAENLGKRYFLGQQGAYTDLREALTDAVCASFRSLAFAARDRDATFRSPLPKHHIWALRHVSFEVEHGDVVGIMGDNGGGKTTLLGILSRITYPTEGYAEIRGRVGTLLDVGAGFHGELTGRENIYLNAAVRRMTRAEINRKFDEVVAFAQLARFIDTPLKYYSSGMCARLAFAVAAHLESEIFLVDEVLAPGDAAFHKKCLEKLKNAAGEGRTVLCVSHDLEYVRQLCSRGLVIADGQIVYDGSSSEAVNYYRSVSGARIRNELPIMEEVLKER